MFNITKAEIVKRLLDQKQIISEEAVVLLRENIVTPTAPWSNEPIYPVVPEKDWSTIGDEPGWQNKTKITCDNNTRKG